MPTKLYPGRRCAVFDIAHTAAVQHVGSEYAVFADSVTLTSLEGLGKRTSFVSWDEGVVGSEKA